MMLNSSRVQPFSSLIPAFKLGAKHAGRSSFVSSPMRKAAPAIFRSAANVAILWLGVSELGTRGERHGGFSIFDDWRVGIA